MHKKQIRQHQRGFTIIEVLVAISVVAILATIVIIAINPARHFREARNTQRRSDVVAILNATYQYMADHSGKLPVDEAGPPDIGISAFLYNINEPGGTDVQFQVSSSSDGTSWSGFVGPDGTAATYYSSAAYPTTTTPPPGLPLGRYFRYQANLTGNSLATPTIRDASFQNGATSLTQTTQAEFNTGSPGLTNTTVTNTAGGEVTLTPTPVSSWDVAPTGIDVYNAPGNENGTDLFIDENANRAYLADSTTFSIINITNKSAPSLVASITAAGTINDMYITGGYAYLATGANAQEITIVDLSSNTIVAGCTNCDMASTTDALSLFASGGYLYVGRASSATAGSNEFTIYNLTSSATNPPNTASYNVALAVNAIVVSGNYAYLATSSTTAELTILNVTNRNATPTAVTCSASACNLAGTAAATDVFLVGNTVYVTRNANTGAPEVSILSVTPSGNTATVSVLGSYEVNANVGGIHVANNHAFLGTSLANQQLMILNVTDPANIPAAVAFNLTDIGAGIYQGGNYIYVANAGNAQELRILQAGTVAGYMSSGSFTAGAFFDFGSSPTTITAGTTPLIVGNAASVPGTGTHINLCDDLAGGAQTYLTDIPHDPSSGSGSCASGDLNSNYTITVSTGNRVTVSAPSAEGGATISATK